MTMLDHQYNERHHTWAFDIRDNYVHISKAASGKKGYYCVGCKREMVAVVNFKDSTHKQYYRHDVANEHEAKCTYSDETTRHKIAKAVLQQLGEIKVPATYSYPPPGSRGKPMLIRREKFIKAHSIEIERNFYEDENGQIKWSGKEDRTADGRNYLIRPDVIFFNKDRQPILFIELVARHKISEEKKVKIRRLGIDTVQVRLPIDSQEEIERTFKIIERTKWIYNYEQESTKYVRIPQTSGETVSSIDEIQGELLEETYSCRAAEIRNLLFAIKRCLESESYRAIEDSFGREISRIEGNTEGERQRRRGIQGAIDAQLESDFRGEMDRLRAEEESVENQDKEFRQQSEDLEKRYFAKREDLEREEKAFRDRIKSEIGEEGFGGFDVAGRKRELIRQTETIDFDIAKEESTIKKIESDLTSSSAKAEQEETNYRAKIFGLEGREKQACDDLRNDIAELPSRYEKIRTDLERQQQEQDRNAVERIKNRIGDGDTEVSRSIKRTLEMWRLLDNYKNDLVIAQRYRQAYECFKQGRYKNWNEFRTISNVDGPE